MRVLLVDDDESVLRFLSRSLEKQGYTVDSCLTGDDALVHARTKQHDCLVLDWNLPGQKGPTVVRTLRDEGNDIPVLMITGDPEGQVVDALEAGADDYCGKPIGEEFYARLNALMRRTKAPAPNIEAGTLLVRDSDRTCEVEGKPLRLSRLEFDLLRNLAKKAREPVSRAELLKAVWGHREDPVSNNVDVLVGRVRQRLNGTPWKIIALRGVGYKLTDAPE